MFTSDAGYPPTFPSAFVQYCKTNCIPPSVFLDLEQQQSNFPRYIRVNPAVWAEWTAAETNTDKDGSACIATARQRVAEALHLKSAERVVSVDWLPCFCFAVPRSTPLSGVAAFEHGDITAMDAASMAAVVALRPRRGDRVLDLCCSPGMKLNLMADAVAGSEGFVVGVDVSLPRLYVARSQVVKHAKPGADVRACLVAADGCTVRTAAILAEALDTNDRAKVQRHNGLTAVEERRLKSSARVSKRPRSCSSSVIQKEAHPSVENPLPAASWSPLIVYAPADVRAAMLTAKDSNNGGSSSHAAWDGLYDRVLVDAECTHDGSIAHLTVSKKETANDVDAGDLAPEGITNVHRMAHMNLPSHENVEEEKACFPANNERERSSVPDEGLFQLQLALLRNGFAQLRPGGTLVYSTCSFSYWQNEHVVSQFLAEVNQPMTAAAGGKEDVVVAQLVPPFIFDYPEDDNGKPLAECMGGGQSEGFVALQGRLDSSYDRYNIVAHTRSLACREICTTDRLIGARFWPCDFQTSFQYIAKMVKHEAEKAGSASLPQS